MCRCWADCITEHSVEHLPEHLPVSHRHVNLVDVANTRHLFNPDVYYFAAPLCKSCGGASYQDYHVYNDLQFLTIGRVEYRHKAGEVLCGECAKWFTRTRLLIKMLGLGKALNIPHRYNRSMPVEFYTNNARTQ